MRRVFFSFHFDDVWRVNQVRNIWLTKGREAGYIDAAEFEKIERKGNRAVMNWIDEQLDGTSVTVVLIGSKTLSRRFVKYEIQQSIKRKNGLVGIHINQIKDKNGKIKRETSASLDKYDPRKSAEENLFSEEPYKTFWYEKDTSLFKPSAHTWISDNLDSWIENAATLAGR
jgi:hypothetical protein